MPVDMFANLLGLPPREGKSSSSFAALDEYLAQQTVTLIEFLITFKDLMGKTFMFDEI